MDGRFYPWESQQHWPTYIDVWPGTPCSLAWLVAGCNTLGGGSFRECPVPLSCPERLTRKIFSYQWGDTGKGKPLHSSEAVTGNLSALLLWNDDFYCPIHQVFTLIDKPLIPPHFMPSHLFTIPIGLSVTYLIMLLLPLIAFAYAYMCELPSRILNQNTVKELTRVIQ